MTSTTRIFIALAVLGALGLGLAQIGPAPVETPSEPATPTAAAPAAMDSRESFIGEEIPRSYPTLIKALRVLGTETVVWTTQAGESRKQVLTLDPDGLLIETALTISAPSTEASASSTKANVKMRDTDLDGKMDAITYVDPEGGSREVTAPFDEASQYAWDAALAIAIRFGRCCR